MAGGAVGHTGLGDSVPRALGVSKEGALSLLVDGAALDAGLCTASSGRVVPHAAGVGVTREGRLVGEAALDGTRCSGVIPDAIRSGAACRGVRIEAARLDATIVDNLAIGRAASSLLVVDGATDTAGVVSPAADGVGAVHSAGARGQRLTTRACGNAVLGGGRVDTVLGVKLADRDDDLAVDQAAVLASVAAVAVS